MGAGCEMGPKLTNAKKILVIPAANCIGHKYDILQACNRLVRWWLQWLDIGRHDDLERAREDYRKVFAV